MELPIYWSHCTLWSVKSPWPPWPFEVRYLLYLGYSRRFRVMVKTICPSVISKMSYGPPLRLRAQHTIEITVGRIILTMPLKALNIWKLTHHIWTIMFKFTSVNVLKMWKKKSNEVVWSLLINITKFLKWAISLVHHVPSVIPDLLAIVFPMQIKKTIDTICSVVPQMLGINWNMKKMTCIQCIHKQDNGQHQICSETATKVCL